MKPIQSLGSFQGTSTKHLVFLSGLVAINVSLTTPLLAADSRAAFSLTPELFEYPPSDLVTTEQNEEGR